MGYTIHCSNRAHIAGPYTYAAGKKDYTYIYREVMSFPGNDVIANGRRDEWPLEQLQQSDKASEHGTSDPQ